MVDAWAVEEILLMEEDFVNGINVKFSPWNVRKCASAILACWISFYEFPLHARDSMIRDLVVSSVGIVKGYTSGRQPR